MNIDEKGMFILMDDTGWTSCVLYRTLRDALNDVRLFFNDDHWRYTESFRLYEINDVIDMVHELYTIYRDGRIIGL